MKKIAVITGASSGMGREMAFQLADHFEVLEEIWLIARRKERLEELRGQFPANIRCFALDITDEVERKQLEAALAEEKPDVKFLVNAAGFGKIGNVGDLSEGDECGMVRLNCEALCAMTHLVLPYMSRGSRIIQFASSAAFLPAAEIRHLRSDQIVCPKLQQGIEAGVKAKRHWRDSSLSGSGKNRVFRHCGDHREDSII